MNRDIRVFRYLAKNVDRGFSSRDMIMHWTGFPSPRSEPVTAYVEFQNAVMRLNARLARWGYQIVRNGGEGYRLVYVREQAA